MADKTDMLRAAELLKQYFGHSSFRDGQEKIISKLISGKDVLGIMPTGAGKSVCYQIPALMAEGITLVISPLISLMNDQVTALVQSGIRGAYYNSTLTAGQRTRVRRNMENGLYKIIYVAPERLETESFKAVCNKLDISYIAIDEAHCVSQWGQDFRPSYMKIPEFINDLPRRPVVGAFTATATEAVKRDILTMLELNEPYTVTTGFDRPNLYFEVRRPKTLAGRMDEVLEILDSHEGKSGIIYCSTRKSVDELYETLSHQDYNVTRYHAGLDADERGRNQEDFIYDRKPVMIATNAFGMGIDKPDVAFVVHFNITKNIENYYQEAGRAGRDGSNADCIMLYMPKDIYTIKYFIDNSENEELTPGERSKIRRLDYIRLNKMVDYCTMNTCLRNTILRYFGESPGADCGNCSECTGRKRAAEKRRKKQLRPTVSESDMFEKLRLERLRLSRLQGVPPYVIMSDATLRDICMKKPMTRAELLEVSGIGAAKADRYGDGIISIVKEFLN